MAEMGYGPLKVLLKNLKTFPEKSLRGKNKEARDAERGCHFWTPSPMFSNMVSVGFDRITYLFL